jgi:hypothetical protein
MTISSSGEGARSPQSNQQRTRYWTRKAIATDATLILLALISAYLEFVSYPAMLYSFGERDVKLSISFLAFQYASTRCIETCEQLSGPPVLDFFQVFVLILAIVNVLRYRSYRKNKISSQTQAKT